MNEKEDSTGKVKSPEEELIEALPEEVLKSLVARGSLVPVTDDNGAINYRRPSGFNRLFDANPRRRD